MFYTEYRPQKFAELIGAEDIVVAITSALAKGSPAHAYFFTGSRGTGKTTTARLLAKSLNCESPVVSASAKTVKFEPCGKCASCKAIQAGSHMDLIEIDAASNRGIDNIRDLKEGVNLAPTMGKNKIYIIDEVHMLTTEASNALLKTLEEPPAHAYFVLCTTNPEKVLDTIKSRCQVYHFKRPSVASLTEKLQKIATDKGHKIEEGALHKIASAARGAFRDAETILEQIVNGGLDANEFLKQQNKSYAEFVGMLLDRNAKDAINHVHEVYASGSNIEKWTEELLAYTRAIMLAKIGVHLEGQMDLSDIDMSLSTRASASDLRTIIELFSKALYEFKFAVIPTLPLEMAIVEMGVVETTDLSEDKSNPIKSVPLDKSPKEIKIEPKVESVAKAEKPKVVDKPQAPKKSVNFSYKSLIDAVKPMNHAIHLILHSCRLTGFDGKNLDIEADYSFHKERLMSHKIREIIETAAGTMCGSPVVLRCSLSEDKPEGRRLTDKNVILANTAGKIDDVFEQVFGDSLDPSPAS